MKLLTLDVKAFNRFRAPFTVPLDHQGLVLVEGENLDGGDSTNSNGAGKSLAIVETLLWCAFGKMARYRGKAVADEAAHPQNGAHVSVTFESRGFQYTMTRSRTAKGNPTFMVGGPQSPVPFSKDPHQRVADASALLGFDYDAFRYSVVVQGGDSLARAGFTTQMAVLESILRLRELGDASDLARQRGNQLEKELAGAQVEMRLRQQACTQAEQLLQQIKEIGSTDHDGELARLGVELQQAEWAAGVLPGLRDTVRGALGTHNRAQSDAAGRRAEWGAAHREVQETERSLASAICPTCRRPLKSADEQAGLQARLQELQQASLVAQQVFTRAEQTLNLASTKKQAMEGELRERETQAAQAPRIQQQINQLRQQQEEFAQQVAAAEAQVTATQAALTDAGGRLGPLEARTGRLQFWASGYGRDGLQAELFAAAVPVLNHAATRYAQLLTGGRIQVTFNPFRGTRTEDLIRVDGASAPTYDGLSRGEKERVDLILAFSLRNLARWRLPEPVNVSIYDEVFDHVDEAGLRVVARLLAEEAQAGGSVFVVTHNAAMKALFPGARVLRVVRQNNEAVVRYVS